MKRKSNVQDQNAFVFEIISKWSTRGVKFNKGNINILKYAFITKVAWALYRAEEVNKTAYDQYLDLRQTSLWPKPVITKPGQLTLVF